MALERWHFSGGNSGAVRRESLTASDLAAMQNHELRLDYSGNKRSVRKDEDDKAIPPLIWSKTGKDLLADYAAHVEGAKRNSGAGKICCHAFIQFPTDLIITEETEKRMLQEAVDFVNRTNGGDAVFRARLDRDEEGQHGVDVFFAPKYTKTTKRGSATWISLTKFSKAMAVARFGEKQAEKKNEKTGKFEPVFDDDGQPVMVDCDSAYYQGRAFQDEWFEHMRDRMGLDWVERGKPKVGRDPDRLEPEEYGLERQREELEKSQERLENYQYRLEEAQEAFEKEKAEHEKMTGFVEIGLENLQVAIDQIQAGTYDTEIFLSAMPDQPKKFAALKAAAPNNRPTWGFRNRFWSLNYSDTGEPLPLPENIRINLTKAFDRVALWAAEVGKARIAAQEALRGATEAAKGILDAARADAAQITQEATQKAQTEAKGILQQAHKDAASLEPLAETIRVFQDAPEGMQQLALNLEATEEVAMEALRRLGVAEKRLDLFGEYAGQDRDPPPVLELVMKRTGRRAQEKTNDLMATLARNGPRR